MAQYEEETIFCSDPTWGTLDCQLCSFSTSYRKVLEDHIARHRDEERDRQEPEVRHRPDDPVGHQSSAVSSRRRIQHPPKETPKSEKATQASKPKPDGSSFARLLQQMRRNLFKAAEASSEQASEQAASKQASEDFSEQVSEETSEKVSEPGSQQASEQVAEQASEDFFEQVSEDTPEQATEDFSGQATEDFSEQVVEPASEDFFEQAFEPVSDQDSYDFSEEASEHASELGLNTGDGNPLTEQPQTSSNVRKRHRKWSSDVGETEPQTRSKKKKKTETNPNCSSTGFLNKSFWKPSGEEESEEGYRMKDPVFRELTCNTCNWDNFSKAKMLRHIYVYHAKGLLQSIVAASSSSAEGSEIQSDFSDSSRRLLNVNSITVEATGSNVFESPRQLQNERNVTLEGTGSNVSESSRRLHNERNVTVEATGNVAERRPNLKLRIRLNRMTREFEIVPR